MPYKTKTMPIVLLVQTFLCSAMATPPKDSTLTPKQRPLTKIKRKKSKYRPTNIDLDEYLDIREPELIKDWAEVAYLLKIKEKEITYPYASNIKGPHELKPHIAHPLQNFMKQIKITNDEEPLFLRYLAQHKKSGFLEKHKRVL